MGTFRAPIGARAGNPCGTSRAVPGRAAGERLYDRVISAVERELIGQVMQQCDQVQVKAAQRLGMNRNTLHQKLKEFSADDSTDVAK